MRFQNDTRVILPSEQSKKDFVDTFFKLKVLCPLRKSVPPLSATFAGTRSVPDSGSKLCSSVNEPRCPKVSSMQKKKTNRTYYPASGDALAVFMGVPKHEGRAYCFRIDWPGSVGLFVLCAVSMGIAMSSRTRGSQYGYFRCSLNQRGQLLRRKSATKERQRCFAKER